MTTSQKLSILAGLLTVSFFASATDISGAVNYANRRMGLKEAVQANDSVMGTPDPTKVVARPPTRPDSQPDPNTLLPQIGTKCGEVLFTYDPKTGFNYNSDWNPAPTATHVSGTSCDGSAFSPVGIAYAGIGPQGYGGVSTALWVAVETYACHITALPVAVNIQCHAARRKTAII